VRSGRCDPLRWRNRLGRSVNRRIGDVYAYRIRKKLHDEQGEFLQNDPSVGYRIAVEEAEIDR